MASLSDLTGGGGVNLAQVALNDLDQVSSNITIDVSNEQAVEFEPTADLTVNFTNLQSDGRALVYVAIKGGGDHALTWQVEGSGTNLRWPGGAAPILVTGAENDLLVFIQSGSSRMVGYEEARSVTL